MKMDLQKSNTPFTLVYSLMLDNAPSPAAVYANTVAYANKGICNPLLLAMNTISLIISTITQ